MKYKKITNGTRHYGSGSHAYGSRVFYGCHTTILRKSYSLTEVNNVYGSHFTELIFNYGSRLPVLMAYGSRLP